MILMHLTEGLSNFLNEAYQGNMRLEEYTTRSGDNPIREFIKTLNTSEKARLDQGLERLYREGAFAKYPLVRQLNDFIYELRVKTGDSYIRLLFFKLPDNAAMFTSGFKKKSDKTPPREIETAMQRRNEYISRTGLPLHKGRRRRKN